LFFVELLVEPYKIALGLFIRFLAQQLTHSRSLARFLSSCAAVKVATLRVPARDGRLFAPGVVDFLFSVFEMNGRGAGFEMADMPWKKPGCDMGL
jgi:hypothetical protein